MDVEAKISGLDMMPKYEELAQYVEVVCVVSPLAIDSNDVASITGWLNDGKNWWSEYDKWWYELASVESFVTHTIKRIKNQAEHIEFYDIDMSEQILE